MTNHSKQTIDDIKKVLKLKVGDKIRVPVQKEMNTSVTTRMGNCTILGVYPFHVLVVDRRGIRNCFTYGELYSMALYRGGLNAV